VADRDLEEDFGYILPMKRSLNADGKGTTTNASGEKLKAGATHLREKNDLPDVSKKGKRITISGNPPLYGNEVSVPMGGQREGGGWKGWGGWGGGGGIVPRLGLPSTGTPLGILRYRRKCATT